MRNSEIIENKDGTFEVQNTIGDNVSRGFPFKTFKTLKGAQRYQLKFLTFEAA